MACVLRPGAGNRARVCGKPRRACPGRGNRRARALLAAAADAAAALLLLLLLLLLLIGKPGANQRRSACDAPDWLRLRTNHILIMDMLYMIGQQTRFHALGQRCNTSRPR